MNRHYVYLLQHKDMFYIGKRSLPDHIKTIADDYKYLGSSRSKRPEACEFRKSIKTKIILRTFNTSKEALDFEMKLQRFFKVVENPRFANFGYQTSTGWDCTGTKQMITPERAQKHKNHSDLMKTSFNPMSKKENRVKISKSLQYDLPRRSKMFKERNPMHTEEGRKNHLIAIERRKDHSLYSFINGKITTIYEVGRSINTVKKLVNNQCSPGGRPITIFRKRDKWVLNACPLCCLLDYCKSANTCHLINITSNKTTT